MSAAFTLNLEAPLEEIERIHTAVDILAAADGWQPDFMFQIRLALEEVGTNIVQYGYDEQGRGTSHHTHLQRPIPHYGNCRRRQPFDPFSDAPPPDLDSSVADRPIGGLGIHLVRKMMDEAHYRREDGRNRVVLIKREDAVTRPLTDWSDRSHAAARSSSF